MSNIIEFDKATTDRYIANVSMGFFAFLNNVHIQFEIHKYEDFDIFCNDICRHYLIQEGYPDTPILKYVMRNALEKHLLTKDVFLKLFKKKYG